MQYKIIVDKQSRTNPSSEKKEYIIDIEELRVLGDVYDSLVITPEEDYVMRRLKLSEYYVLSVLEEPIKQPIADVNIELFEGDNYIYLIDMEGNKFYAEYLIKNDFNNTFATKAEMNSVINQTAQSIELSVNQKLTGYSTTEEMNASINMKANEITSTVNEKFEDYDTSSEVSSKIEQKANSITSTVSSTYATKNELTTAKSEIKQTTDSITSTVSTKVGKTEVSSTINQTAQGVKINAEKLDLTGLVTVSDIQTSGKTTINGSNITTGTIDASKANITNINASNITSGTITGRNITGGTITGTKITGTSTIDLQTTGHLEALRVIKNNNTSTMTYMTEAGIGVNNIDDHIELYCGDNPGIDVYRNGATGTYITHTEIKTPTLTQTSLKSKKKNIKKLNANAIDLIKNSDICLYNLKGEKAKSKKHIGLVIGEGYNCPDEVIAQDGQGVEQYSMISLAWKAIQELIEENNNLKQRIKKLEAK